MPKRTDITSQRFGRLVAVKKVDGWYRGQWWLCRCDCGSEATVVYASLRRGLTHSCGCLRREKTSQRSLKHGYTVKGHDDHRRTYNSWKDMFKRCYNKNRRDYKYWGGRGIKVCWRWRSFEAFLADMGERPPGLTLDRIQNSSNYKPGNCRWATRAEQNRNSRNLKSRRRGPPRTAPV